MPTKVDRLLIRGVICRTATCAIFHMSHPARPASLSSTRCTVIPSLAGFSTAKVFRAACQEMDTRNIGLLPVGGIMGGFHGCFN